MSGKKQRVPDVTEYGEQAMLPGSSTPSTRRRVGPVERGVDKACRTARVEGVLTDLDAGTVQLAKTLARTVDWCHSNTEPHTLTMAAARLSEVLTKLKLEPAAREVKQGVKSGIDWDAALAEFSSPAEGPGAPQSRDTPQP